VTKDKILMEFLNRARELIAAGIDVNTRGSFGRTCRRIFRTPPATDWKPTAAAGADPGGAGGGTVNR
jgi:hypothetical protein